MRCSRWTILVLLPALAVSLAVPPVAAGVDEPTVRRVERTNFEGAYFPAGMPGTQTECPYTWADPAFCMIDPGTQTVMPDGRLNIRAMKLYELAFSYTEDGAVEPRKTGYDIVYANAVLDGTLSGPTWGLWKLHSFDHELMFKGWFYGSFEDGIPAVHFMGRGVGEYRGQQMSGFIGRELDEDGFNMVGRILERVDRS